MLCALTVRRLKPGSFEQFKEAFVPSDDVEVPSGWQRFYALRNVGDENEVITFGFFDGTLDELRAGQQGGDYEQRRAATEEFIENIGPDGIYEIVEERTLS